MDIHSLKETASQRLSTAREEKYIILIYAGITVGFSALVTVINYLANNGIAQTGGLSNIGLRSVLYTLQQILPMLQSLVLMIMELGLANATLRIARNQYASAHSLRMGADRFFQLIRCMVAQGFLYFLVGMVTFSLAVQIYLFTPLSNTAMEILTPLLADRSALSGSTLTLSAETAWQLAEAMIPMFILFGVLCAAVCIPLMYQFRMVNYVLIDNPRLGGRAVLKESRKIMRKHCLQLFKLDLSFWWYYLLLLIVGFLCYGETWLALAGISLPFSGDVSFFFFYVLFLAATVAVYYFFRNPVEVTYALFYEQFKPKEEQDNAVVLGNIFQM